MRRIKFLMCVLAVLFIFPHAGLAAAKGKTAIKLPPQATPLAPAAKVVAPSADPAVTQADLEEYKGEVNSAVSTLKQQIDKVSADNGDAKVGGQIFFRWQKYLTNSTTPNNFDVERAYIDVKNKIGSASSRVTLDVVRLSTDTRKNLFDYLKYAYVDIPLGVAPFLQPVPYDLTGIVGLQHTAWIDWDDKIMGMRWIAKSLVDNEGVMSSADFGLGAKGKICVPGLPEIEYHATALNGTGYATAETNSAKNLDIRLNASLYKNEDAEVLLGIFSNNVGLLGSGLTASASNWGGTLAYKNDWSTLYGEYLTGTVVNGYSVGGWLGLPASFKIFARKDYYTPDVNTANNQLDRLFYGIIYELNKDVKFSADVQSVTGGSSASTSRGTTATAFYLHSVVYY